MIKVRRKIGFTTRAHGQQVIIKAPCQDVQIPSGRIPRISRLMALAIHFDRLIREGMVMDISELARLAHVTQPRMTQIMNLNHLAPDIQEQLLFLPAVESGRDAINERTLRPIASEVDWLQQRNRWQTL
ncbi:MAG TPA: hypothetical protein PKN33_16930 [Phycisphaerae bacterium]|nr:hypothetical protein [Phycisphaerae bacterium]